MRISAFCTAVLTYVVIGHPPPAAAQVDQQRAQEYFKEAQALCERDGGRLWGVSLCAPMVIADARTHTFATSQPPPDAPRPRLIGLVNAPIQWGETTWVSFNWDTIAWPARTRGEAFYPRMFHLVQPGLGLMQLAAANEHLDRRWTVLAAARMARARTGAAGIRRGACGGRSRRARLPPGAAHAVSRQRRKRARGGDHGRPPRTPRRCWPRHPRPTRSRARSSSWRARRTGTASCARSRTRPGRPMAFCSMPRRPGGRERCATPTTSARLLMHALSVQPAADAAASAARYGGAEIRRPRNSASSSARNVSRSYVSNSLTARCS